MVALLSPNPEHEALLMASFSRLLQRPLWSSSTDATLWTASVAVVSHGVEADPLFNYANRQALSLFGYAYTDFIGLPSRFSAEPIHREQRQHLLSQVSERGYFEGYEGVRIALSGRRFKIMNAIIWNVMDDAGGYRGQAAMIPEWAWVS